MNFVAILIGEGEGCDYTIGCNMSYRIFTVDSVEEALGLLKEDCKDFSDPSIEEIILYEVRERISVPVDKWNTEIDLKAESEHLKDELEELEERKKELQRKLEVVNKTK